MLTGRTTWPWQRAVTAWPPQGVPEPVQGRLREAMRHAMASPEVVRTFEASGSPPAFLDAPDFVEADSARLVAAVRRIGRVE